jgi:hypothetical protein
MPSGPGVGYPSIHQWYVVMQREPPNRFNNGRISPTSGLPSGSAANALIASSILTVLRTCILMIVPSIRHHPFRHPFPG